VSNRRRIVLVIGAVFATGMAAMAWDVPSASASCDSRNRCYQRCTESHQRCLRNPNNRTTYCWQISEECNRSCERLYSCP
jgi:hypothetical protein